MNKKCLNCGLVNFPTEPSCRRCHALFEGNENLSFTNKIEDTSKKLDRAFIWFVKRFLSALAVSAVILCGFYFSLLYSAKPLSAEQSAQVERAVQILADRGFNREVYLLRNTVAFRATDNWLNETTGHENAYAATNFPFQIVTLYESFFLRPVDETEQAMILLHEAQHLLGGDEQQAYEFVWRNKKQLGWTADKYSPTPVWQNVFEFTKQNAPNLFHCNFNQNSDCTE